MSHYKSNVRDLFFNLFELHKVQNQSFGKGPYTHIDEETAKDLLTQMKQLSEGEYSAGFASADEEGLHFNPDTGDVTIPEGTKRALSAYYEGEWQRMTAPEHLGGYGFPPSVYWAAFELLAGANASAVFYSLGEVNAQVIDRLGTSSQKERFCEAMIERHWGGTMMLTEPDAGSDVGAGLSKAKHLEGDIWSLEGVKRYITNGDFDHTENIIHLVLARPEGAKPGTKGLSMFIVPKFWVNEDGTLGERNGVYVSGIEEKMGLHASATCEMTLGERGLCRGFLVGDVHDGIRQMFQVIEHARMAVGFKSFSTLSTAYLNALEYTKERKQGPALTEARNPDAPRVAIIEHPDVRRMLMTQKSYAEGMRSLGLYAASIQDQVAIAGGHGSTDAKALDRRNDLLLPLIKGYCSEKVYALLGSTSLQCFGGAGYIRDYPIEQYVRDQKIDTLYEGTTHIQALDLIFRKIAKDGGNTLRDLLKEMKDTASNDNAHSQLAVLYPLLTRAIQELEMTLMGAMKKMGESINHIGLQANRILESLAELVIGWLLIRGAEVAQHAIDAGANGRELAFYQGKVASALFYCKETLPRLTLARKLLENGDLSLMDLDNSCF